MAAPAQTLAEELEGYRTLCFWWVPKTVALIDLPREMLVCELNIHGGHAGMRLAARLQICFVLPCR